jgi:hypothetical protein
MVMTDEELKKVSEALAVLHRRFGGMKWEIEVGPPVYSPTDFKPFRELRVNGQLVEKMPTEVQG